MVKELDCNRLVCWFIGLSIDGPIWDHSTLTKNRDWLLEGDIDRRFLAEAVDQAREPKRLPDEPLSVDGTLGAVILQEPRPGPQGCWEHVRRTAVESANRRPTTSTMHAFFVLIDALRSRAPDPRNAPGASNSLRNPNPLRSSEGQ